MRRLCVSLALVAAVGALVASVTFAVGQASRPRPAGPGMMTGQSWSGTGTGMMGGAGGTMGTVWLAGDATGSPPSPPPTTGPPPLARALGCTPVR